MGNFEFAASKVYNFNINKNQFKVTFFVSTVFLTNKEDIEYEQPI